MAFIIFESFDLVGSAADIIAKGMTVVEGTYDATGGRFGGGGLDLGSSFNDMMGKNLTLKSSEPYHSAVFWWKTESVATSGAFAVIYANAAPSVSPNTNTYHAGLTFTSGGDLVLYTGGSNRLTLSSPFNNSTWYHIEMRCFINNSGSFQLYINGALVIDFSGDTDDGSSNQSFVMSATTGGDITIDDLVIQQDASALPAVVGEHRIQTLLPDGSGTNAAWTGTFADVDDAINASSDGDSTFISETTLNDKHDFTCTNLGFSPTSVIAVNLVTEARKTDSGTIGVTPFVLSNGTEGAGTEFSAAETYSYTSDIFLVDPDTASAWTESGINAIQIGVEITT